MVTKYTFKSHLIKFKGQLKYKTKTEKINTIYSQLPNVTKRLKQFQQ